MNRLRYIFRSLVHRRREHAAVAAGVALTTAVLVGALTLGDSMRASLHAATAARLGRAVVAVAAGERPFKDDLAQRLGKALGGETAPVLLLNGALAAADGQTHAVQVVGVDDRFWRLAPRQDAAAALSTNSVAIGDLLARRGGLAADDSVTLRVPVYSAIPVEAPIAAADGRSAVLRARIVDVLDAPRFGRFGLRSNHTPALNVFVSLSELQRRTGLDGRANLLLVADGAGLSAAEVTPALRAVCGLEDYGLALRALPDDRGIELTSSRLFVDAPVEQASAALGGRPLFTYFVNAISSGDASIPYSFVSAPHGPPAPDGLPEDGIVLNAWAAGDLGIGPDAAVTLSYYTIGAGNRLVERSRGFRVHGVIPTRAAAADPDLVPAFPGLAEADNCRDWKPGVPIDLDRIRPKDEEYWASWRGAPKGFVTLAAAREMWGSRFGSATAVRFPPGEPSVTARALLERLDPAAMGLHAVDALALGRRAGEQGTDFGGLFLGMSLFIVAAALSLTGMLTAFSIERRISEIGTLRALGFPVGLVRKLLAVETLAVAAVGAALGGWLGLGYRHLLMAGLRTVWRGAVGVPDLTGVFGAASLASGVAAGLLMSGAVLALALHRQTRRALSVLQGAAGESLPPSPRASRTALAAAAAACALALVLMAFGARGRSGHEAAGVFFGAGALLLAASLCGAYAALAARGSRPARPRSGGTRPSRFAAACARRLGAAARPAFWTLALRDASRRRGRSLAVVTTLACGVFVVIAVGANRRQPPADPSERASGTGGFALYAESALPVVDNPGEARGLRALGIEPDRLAGVGIVPIRLRDGDDASCLNLNRAQQPRILGVPVAELARREAFSFAEPHASGPAAAAAWALLDAPQPDGAIPAAADQTVIAWQLGLHVGDTIEIVDEHGRPAKLRLVAALANSVLQGSILVSQENFQRLFVSEPGFRAFLIDGPRAADEPVRRLLNARLTEFGFSMTRTDERLRLFNEVENTYLSMFLGLGGLGLVLGAAGLGIVLARNVLDRRHELAILCAVGFRRRLVLGLLTAEHVLLLAAGLLAGTLSALAAVAPVLAERDHGVPLGSIVLLVLTVAGSGLAGVALFAGGSLPTDLAAGLRDE